MRTKRAWCDITKLALQTLGTAVCRLVSSANMRTIFEICKLSGKAKAIDGALPAGIIPEPNAQPNARNDKSSPGEELLEFSSV